MDRGERPKEVLAPRWKRAYVGEKRESRVQRRSPQTKCPSRSKEQPQTFKDSGPPEIQNRRSSPVMVDVAVMSDTSIELDPVLTGTLVGSPAPYSEDSIITVNVDDFLEKIVEDSDLATLSVAKTSIRRAAQKFMDVMDEFDALMYGHCASAKLDNFDVPSFHAGETSIRGAAGEQNSIGMVEAL